jgi:ACS family hexuronate transporter-like MFS transporter
MFSILRIQDLSKRGKKFTALLCAQVFVSLAGLSIPPLIPFFKSELEFSYTQVGSIMTFLYFGAMVMSIPAGWLTDRLGIKKMVLLSQAFIGFFVFFFGIFTNNYLIAILSAFLMGLGYGMVNPPTTKGITLLVDRENRGFAMSLKQTGVPIGGAMAAALLPSLAISFSWKHSFALTGISVIIAGVLCYFLYGREEEEPLSSYIKTNSDHVEIKKTLQGNSEKGYVNKNIFFLSTAGAFCSFAQIALVTYIVLYLKDFKNFELILATFCLTLTNIGGIVGRILWGVVSDRLFGGARKPVLKLIVLLIFAISFIFGLNLDLPFVILAPIIFIFGVSAVGWNGVYHAFIGELSAKETIGKATGLCMMITFLGNIGGPIVFGKIIDVTGSYNTAWFSLCLSMAAAFSMFSLIREKKFALA